MTQPINWDNPIIAPYKQALLNTSKLSNAFTLEYADNLNLWDSKMGGQPYMPINTEYPKTTEGQPLVFLAQINFAHMPPLPDFPKQGILQFFIAHNEHYGADCDNNELRKQDGFRVIYHADVIEDVSQLRQDIKASYPPQEHEDDDYLTPHDFYHEYAMRFKQEKQLISYNDFGFERILERQEGGKNADWFQQQKDDDEELEEEIWELFCIEGHRVGGYPNFTQNDPRASAQDDFKDYILLFQLDTDDDMDIIMWGDSGVGNFFIHPDDLKKCDFSRVAYTWDCY